MMTGETKKLYRSRDERMVAGVCGGVGEYFNADPTVIRIIFVILAILGFGVGGLVLYLAMWLIIPEEPMMGTPPPPAEEPAVEQSVEDKSE